MGVSLRVLDKGVDPRQNLGVGVGPRVC